MESEAEHSFHNFVNPHLSRLLRTVKLDKSFRRARGAVLEDAAGRSCLDFIAGYGSVPFGHNPPELWDAILRQRDADEPSMVQPSMLDAAGQLAARLVAIAPEGLDYVCFANSGAEANEAAIKACRSATGRLGIIAAANSFHGKTLGALSATGAAKYQQAFGAPVPGFRFVPYGDLAAIERELAAHARETAAILLEPIQGEGGIVVPPEGYLRAVRDLADRYDVLLILDEVQTGLGRTGVPFAAMRHGVRPDCMTVAKALGGGMVPIGACLMNARVFNEEFAMRHSSTFAGNGFACRIALASLDLLTKDNWAILANVRERGAQLAAGHARLAERFPNVVREARGEGLMLGLAFEVDRAAFPADWGTYLAVLGEQDNIVPLLASYLLNVEGIRTAPTLNHSNVLRIEPPLTISADECETYLGAIERTVSILAQGNTGALIAHLTESSRPVAVPRSRPFHPRTPVAPAEDGSEGRFAFLVHPIDENSYVEFDESLQIFTPDEIRTLAGRLSEFMDPFPMAGTRIVSQTGAVAYGEFICIPHSAKAMMEMPPDKVVEIVRSGVEMARDRGAKIVGLGGYTSVVTRGGTRVANLGVAVTTGNSYTVMAAMEAVELASLRLGLSLPEAEVTVVGAGGSIGSAAAHLLTPKVGGLTLVGSPRQPEKTRRRFLKVVESCIAAFRADEGHAAETAGGLSGALRRHPAFPVDLSDAKAVAAFAGRLLDENGAIAPLRWSLDVGAALPRCDLVVIATSSPDEIISPEMVKPGAILCDMSRPSNVSRRMADERPDVLVIDGGVVEIPNRPDLGWNFGFPRGIGYACMAETMMLGLARHYENTSIGIDLDQGNRDLLRALAAEHGFKLAGLRSFDRVLNAVDWQWLRKQRARRGAGAPASGLQHRLPAEFDHVRQNVGSIGPDEPANVTLYLVDRHVDGDGADRTALIEGDRSVTYRELAVLMHRAAHLLLRNGIAKGDAVAIASYDTIAATATLLAAMRIGAVAINLNSFLRPEQYKPLLEFARPKMLLVGRDLVPELKPVFDTGWPQWLELDPWLSDAAGQSAAEPVAPAMVAAGDGAICLFSSGSTGQPKAVVHSHADLINTNLNYVASVLGIGRDDVLFSPSKMFFAYGFNSVHYALFAGAAAILAPRRSVPERVFDLIERHRPTVFFAVPTIYLLMLNRQDLDRDLSSLRLCVSAGEPLPEDVYDAWKGRFGLDILDGIGTTEVLSTFVSNMPGDIKPGSTGKVVPGFEVQLRTEDGRLAALGEIGVLWVRGNTVARGYWRDPETTAHFFEDGWFNTNDLFYRDARGHFYYVGRSNDVLKVGGCWVAPAEIEKVITRHEAVSECAVVPRVEFGKLIRPKALVVLRDGIAPGPALAEALKAFAREHLAPQQYPHFVEFVPSLPRTVTGKLQRALLREREMQAS